MSSTVNSRYYEDAVRQLNNLQSNAEVLAKIRKQRKQMMASNLPETLNFLEYLGINVENINQLNCIHVAGTKGKGSTCAFLESIFQSCGFKTGLYSSPHLVHVRERIRINGRPLSEDVFASCFFDVFNTIKQKKDESVDMPGYFKFLTLMAFKVFCDKGVQVAIIEVGIGGEHDCTNVIRNPVVCGITSLDYDHINLLGSSLPEIAWQKAGIVKRGSTLVSVQQPSEALEVIKRRCEEVGCKVYLTPSITEYIWPNVFLPHFGIDGEHQSLNASLSLQLARFWFVRMRDSEVLNRNFWCQRNPEIRKFYNNPDGSPLVVPNVFEKALSSCVWPGRSQTLRRREAVYFLDSAHTPQSIEYCKKWFSSVDAVENGLTVVRVLLFHCTGERDPTVLLSPFKDCNFSMALFCPVKLRRVLNQSNDNTNNTALEEVEWRKCEKDAQIWRDLVGESSASSIFPCIEDALNFVNTLSVNNPNSEIHVLVTGSLHLVGGVLHFVKPDVFEEEKHD